MKLEEDWKPIPGYEKDYEVSSNGRIRNVNTGHILRPSDNRTGYLCVTLVIGGKKHYEYVHRLVARAFVPNPDNLPQINHKDENSYNNSIDNLEWCTPKYNSNYGTASLRKVHGERSVYCMTINGFVLHHFKSAADAGRKTGIGDNKISECCRGEAKTAGGVIWRYE
jgi:hypothetical protein